MVRLLVRSVLQSVILLLIVTALTFVLQSLVPGDAARVILGTEASEDQYLQLREKLGLDQPLYERFMNYWIGVFQGSLGTTLQANLQVSDLLLQRLPVTLSLVLLGTVVTLVVGVAFGVWGSRRGVTGTAVDVVSLLGLAIPSFWVAIALVSVFAVAFPLFPATGYVAFEDSPIEWLHSLILPVLALSLTSTSIIAKTTRDSVADNMNRLWVRTLRANGVDERSIVWRHALKNAAIPILSVAHIAFVGALGSSVLVENVFALPGLGSLMVVSIYGHDIYVVVGVVLMFTISVVVANILTELGYGWLNPRVRKARA